MKSSLPSELRHLIHVLSVAGDGQTGIGWTGQARLSAYLGVSDRTLRRWLAELDALAAAGKSPVHVERTGSYGDIHGRGSDTYRLVLVAPSDQADTADRLTGTDQPDAGVRLIDGSTGHPAHESDDQPDTGVRKGTDQPDTHVLLSAQAVCTDGSAQGEREHSQLGPLSADAPGAAEESATPVPPPPPPYLPLELPSAWEPHAGAPRRKLDAFRTAFAPGSGASAIDFDHDGTARRVADSEIASVDWSRTWERFDGRAPAVLVRLARGGGGSAIYQIEMPKRVPAPPDAMQVSA
jgi:hypothetical protein